MKNSTTLVAAALALATALACVDADAARRFGGGGNLGRQRPAPMMKEAPASAPATAPAAPAAASPAKPAPAAASPAPAAPQPGFMGRFGGLIAGLGLGALLGSLFGGHLGGLGSLLLVAAIAGLAFVAIRALASRRAPVAEAPARLAGAGADVPVRRPLDIGAGVAATAAAPAQPSHPIPGFEAEPFLRVAKTSFIRLQAANDAGDLDDIRDYTTPEMFAEITMQVRSRGNAPQRTEVVSVDASLVEAVVEGDYAVACVRFTGLMREAPEANPEPFDEIWHVRQDQRDRKATWLIAGIQQAA